MPVWGKNPVQGEYLHSYPATWEKKNDVGKQPEFLMSAFVPNLGPRALRALENPRLKP